MFSSKIENGGPELASPADPGLLEREPFEQAVHGGEIVATATTVVVVAAGAALFEAALLPGIVVGVAAALAARALPTVGVAMAPMFRSSVRGAYRLGRRTREALAEAHEQVNDIVAEAQAEERLKVGSASKAAGN